MADETPQSAEPDQATENPATDYQAPPTVVTLYDRGGREHHASPTSKFAVDGLADGSLTEQPPTETDEPGGDNGGEQSAEEGPDGAEAGSAGHDPEPGTADGDTGSGDGSADTGGAGRRRRAGQA